MGLLLLLTSALLLSLVAVDAVQQNRVQIGEILLSIEPSANVTRGTNVTVRCKATVYSSGQTALNHEFTIYKGKKMVYTKNSSTSEDLLYLLPDTRVSNSGIYECKIKVKGKEKTSESKQLTVRGLIKPILQMDKYEVSEGEEVTAKCSAPGETGSINFIFYNDGKEIRTEPGSSNHFETKLHLKKNITRIYCSYTVLINYYPDSSEQSNVVVVLVKELFMPPVLEIYPKSNIYEGDTINIICTTRNLLNNSEKAEIYLCHGADILSRGDSKINHSMVALAKDPGKFECFQEFKQVQKVTTKTISVTELFSAPTLTMSSADVFQREDMALICRSESVASERLRRDEVTYTLEPPDSHLNPIKPGVFYGKAVAYNYTCAAQAKGIVKHSEVLHVRPKVSVSTPRISVHGKAILGQLIKIRCRSDIGSFPINYTLLKGYEPVSTTTVKLPTQEAIFTVTITKPEELNKYMCEAHNNFKVANGELSERLKSAVIEPLSDLTLTVPDLAEISEGKSLYLICGTKGTPPVTFRLYRDGTEEPVFESISPHNNSNYHIPSVSTDNSGTYFCEAVNHANKVRSEKVTIKVGLALWKKGLIGGACVLLMMGLVVVCVLYFKSKRVKGLRTAVSVWTERPAKPANDEESSVVSSEPDVEYTEVVHPQPADAARVPLRKGTDTVYSELKNPPHESQSLLTLGKDGIHPEQGLVEYAELNGERPEIGHHFSEVNNYQDLPEPVD